MLGWLIRLRLIAVRSRKNNFRRIFEISFIVFEDAESLINKNLDLWIEFQVSSEQSVLLAFILLFSLVRLLADKYSKWLNLFLFEDEFQSSIGVA